MLIFFFGKLCGWIWDYILAPILKRCGYEIGELFDTPPEKVLVVDGQRVAKPITRREGKNNALKGLNPMRKSSVTNHGRASMKELNATTASKKED